MRHMFSYDRYFHEAKSECLISPDAVQLHRDDLANEWPVQLNMQDSNFLLSANAILHLKIQLTVSRHSLVQIDYGSTIPSTSVSGGIIIFSAKTKQV